MLLTAVIQAQYRLHNMMYRPQSISLHSVLHSVAMGLRNALLIHSPPPSKPQLISFSNFLFPGIQRHFSRAQHATHLNISNQATPIPMTDTRGNSRSAVTGCPHRLHALIESATDMLANQ